MELTTKELEYLVARYWLHYYPDLTDKNWTSNEVKNVAVIVLTKLQKSERKLYEAGLLTLPKYDIVGRSGQDVTFLHFEWRLEVSGYGASVIEPLCAMDLMFKLGEVLKLAERGPLYGPSAARQRIAFRCRPASFVLARVMRQISIADLPELLSHDHEFIREIAAQRLMDTPNEGTHVYQYRYNGRGTGSFCGLMLSS